MPEFVVLKCNYSDCAMYQVSQKRQDKKFLCKICHRKQSILNILKRSSVAKECRALVMELNLGKREEGPPLCFISCVEEKETPCLPSSDQESKWNQFLDSSSSETSASDEAATDSQENLPGPLKRKLFPTKKQEQETDSRWKCFLDPPQPLPLSSSENEEDHDSKKFKKYK